MKISPLSTLFAAKAPWNPNFFGSNLAAWYDAADSRTITQSGGAVSQWDDKSGNGFHLKQATGSAQPTTGTGTKFTGKSVITTTISNFMATDDNLTLQNSNTIFLVYSQTNSARSYFTSIGEDSHYVGTGITNSDFRFVHSGLSFSHPNPGNPAIFTALSASADYEFFFDGASVFSSATEPNLYDGQTNKFVLNSRLEGFASFGAAAEYAEIIYINSTLSTSDRQKVEGYLAWKWGLTYGLPESHPYKWDGSLFGYQNLTSLDDDARAYITAVETADKQDLELQVRIAINAFVVGCKADGIWNAIKSSAILAGARTLSGALQPLAGTAPTNFNFVSGDYNRKTGLVGDGSTKYLDSNRNNNADPQDSKHISFYKQAGVSSSEAFIGIPTAVVGGSWFIFASTQTFTRINANTSSNPVFSYSVDSFYGTNRGSSATIQIRGEGSTSQASVSSTSPANAAIEIFGGPSSPRTQQRLAFYSIGESLDLALLDTRVSNLMTAIGAAIP